MQTTGLSLEQAPQLSIPAAFFLAIPLGILAAGCILLVAGADISLKDNDGDTVYDYAEPRNNEVINRLLTTARTVAEGK